MGSDEIGALFDRARKVCADLGNPLEGAEVSIFRAVYTDHKEASEHLGAFLRDMTQCPIEVLEYVTNLIARKKEEASQKLLRIGG